MTAVPWHTWGWVLWPLGRPAWVHGRPPCWFHWKNQSVSRPEQRRRHRLLSAPFGGREARSVWHRPAPSHSRPFVEGRRASRQSPGGFRTLLGPLRCPRAAGWGSPVARGRGAQWPCGGQATPVCLSLHGPCLSRHTCLKGVRGVRTGDERPAPRWGFGVGGVLGRGPRETGRAAFKCFGSQSRATWPKS